MSILPGKLLFKQSVELRFGGHLGEFLNTRTSTTDTLRERAIAEYHDLLAADEALSHAVFEKLAQRDADQPAALRRAPNWRCTQAAPPSMRNNSTR